MELLMSRVTTSAVLPTIQPVLLSPNVLLDEENDAVPVRVQ